MKNLIILLTLIAISLSSCLKNHINSPCENNSLLKQVTTDTLPMQVLTYTSNCQIKESIERYAYSHFLYNSQNRLSRIEKAFILDPTVCYIQPGVDTMEFSDPKKAKISQYFELSYDSAGRLQKSDYYFINSGIPQLTYTYTYEYEYGKIIKENFINTKGAIMQYFTYEYDSNGNVSKMSFYNYDQTGPKIQYSTTYEYDDKNNPFTIFAGEGTPGINTNKNNITKETTISYYSGDSSSYSHSNTYQYNVAGYPVKANNLIYVYGNDSISE